MAILIGFMVILSEKSGETVSPDDEVYRQNMAGINGGGGGAACSARLNITSVFSHKLTPTFSQRDKVICITERGNMMSSLF